MPVAAVSHKFIAFERGFIAHHHAVVFCIQLHHINRLGRGDAETFAREGAPLFSDLGPGQTQVHEQELVRQDGSPFWARISGSRYVDANLGQAVLAVIEPLFTSVPVL